MALPIIFAAISAISSTLKIAEYVEQHGFFPAGDDFIRLNLELAEERPLLERAAQQINSLVGDAEDELFTDAQKRAAECLRSMNRSLNDPDELPERKRRIGRGGRKCACSEIAPVRELVGGYLPEELQRLWKRYRCAEFAELLQSL